MNCELSVHEHNRSILMQGECLGCGSTSVRQADEPQEQEQEGDDYPITLYHPVIIQTDLVTCMGLIGSIQLACRHRKFIGPTRDMVEGFARNLQQNISSMLPESQQAIIEMGWDPNFDID